MKKYWWGESITRTRLTFASVIFLILQACGGGSDTIQGFHVARFSPDNNVGIEKALQIEFSEDVDPTTINNYTVGLWDKDSDVLVDTKFAYNPESKTLRLTPYLPLAYSTNYQINVSAQVRNATGQHIAAEAKYNFTTVPSPMTADYFPPADATGINPRTQIRVQFAHGVDLATVTTENFILNELAADGSIKKKIGGTISKDQERHTAVFTPSTRLISGTRYSYTLSRTIHNTSGASIYLSDLTNSFTTWSTVGFANLLGTPQDDYTSSIGRLNTGEIVIAGTTTGAIDPASNRADGDGFLMALSSTNGERLWVTQFGNENVLDGINDMVIIGNAIYVTGFTDGNFAKTQIKIGNVTGRHLFVAKFTSFGYAPIFEWSTEIGTTNQYLVGRNITADDNAVYVSAQGSGNLPTANGIGSNDVYVFKFDANTGAMSPRWPRIFGTNVDDYVQAISSDSNNIYITGDTLGDWSNPAAGHKGLTPFLLKLAKTGNAGADVVFNTTQVANNAQERRVKAITTTTNPTDNSTVIYIAGKARNDESTFGFVERFAQDGSVAGSIIIDDARTLLDDVPTTLYAADGNIYVGVNVYFPAVNGANNDALHSQSTIYRLDGDNPVALKTISGEMHVGVRDILYYNNAIFVTGFVHGNFNGIAPIGSVDIFFDKI